MSKKCQEILQEIYERAQSNGDEIAVVDCGGQRKTTRSDFVLFFNSAALFLRENGVKQKDVVALELGRCMEHFAFRLACHCIGAIYVSVNPDYPKDRKTRLYEECNPDFYINKDSIKQVNIKNHSCQIDFSVNDDDPGFIVFTSGTTGIPKGILHDRSTYYALKCVKELYRFTGLEKEYGAVVDMMFAASLADMYPIYMHMTMHVLDDETRKDALKIKKYFNEHSIEVTTMLPSLLKLISPVKSLKSAVLAGERNTFDFSDLKVNVVNCYACSEVINVAVGLTSEDQGIGRTMPYSRVYLIDENGKEIEKEDTSRRGEICFTGLTAMIKYLGEDNLPEEKIITDDGEIFILRSYHTKDLGKYNSDGTINVLGRIDTTVKVRGNRVNINEVEYAILNVPGISEAAVKCFSNNNENYLCAYYSTIDGNNIDKKVIIDSIKNSIPEYMIPALFEHKTDFERNTHGKIDRDKLLPIKRNVGEYVEPCDEIETKLCELIEKATNLKKIGVEADLKSIGISSLETITILLEIEELFSISFDLAEFLTFNNIKTIASEIHKRQKNKKYLQNTDILEKTKSNELIPVADVAKSMYSWCLNMQKFNIPELTSYHLAFVIETKGYSFEDIKENIRRLIDNHPVLKASIVERDGESFYLKRDNWYPEIEEYELVKKPNDDFFVSKYRPFIIPGDELVRTDVYSFKDTKYILMDVHHLLGDAYSLWIFRNNIKNAFSNKELIKEDADFFELMQDIAEFKDYNESDTQYFDSLITGRELITIPNSAAPDDIIPAYKKTRTYMFLPGFVKKCTKRNLKPSTVFHTACLKALSLISKKDHIYMPELTFGRKKRGFKTFGFLCNLFIVAYDRIEGAKFIDEAIIIEKQLSETLKHTFNEEKSLGSHGSNGVLFNYLADYDFSGFLGWQKVSQNIRVRKVPSPKLNYANQPLEFKIMKMLNNIYILEIKYDRSLYCCEDVSGIGKIVKEIMLKEFVFE